MDNLQASFIQHFSVLYIVRGIHVSRFISFVKPSSYSYSIVGIATLQANLNQHFSLLYIVRDNSCISFHFVHKSS